MIYEFDLVVPLNTLELAPVKQVLKLTRGVIHKLEVDFAAGCRRMVYVVIRRSLHQVWPTNPDSQFRGDNWVISMPVWYELEEEPLELEAYAWSPGTSYEHTVILRLGVERKEVLQPPRPELGFLQRLQQLIFPRGL